MIGSFWVQSVDRAVIKLARNNALLEGKLRQLVADRVWVLADIQECDGLLSNQSSLHEYYEQSC